MCALILSTKTAGRWRAGRVVNISHLFLIYPLHSHIHRPIIHHNTYKTLKKVVANPLVPRESREVESDRQGVVKVNSEFGG